MLNLYAVYSTYSGEVRIHLIFNFGLHLEKRLKSFQLK